MKEKVDNVEVEKDLVGEKVDNVEVEKEKVVWQGQIILTFIRFSIAKVFNKSIDTTIILACSAFAQNTQHGYQRKYFVFNSSLLSFKQAKMALMFDEKYSHALK